MVVPVKVVASFSEFIRLLPSGSKRPPRDEKHLELKCEYIREYLA
jgi:hypothetical protein